jgi:H+-transporting ATPase
MGLTEVEAAQRLKEQGCNEIAEKRRSPYLQFLTYLWGPIPWMIEAAAILSAIVGDWVDLGIILALLLFNACIGFWQEFQASNAVAALKQQLALKAQVCRDGEWKEIPARELVVGDLVSLKLGEIVPADVELVDGEYLSIDQSALTGESLPVTKKQGDGAYSGSVVSQGEMTAEVTATGVNTYFGKTAQLVAEAHPVSHFQRAVLRIGDYLIYLSVGLALILVVTQLARGDSFLSLLQFTLILIVAAIPVAMPAVLSVTMAVGSIALAQMKAIVTRLESIEEMAGMEILCSDKTGTLTQNKLTVGEPVLYGAKSADELLLFAALASAPKDRDIIDETICQGIDLTGYSQLHFTPFDPVSKRTEALIERDGKQFSVTKGAPQVVLDLCGQQDAAAQVEQLAGQGMRCLAVAIQREGWELLGILPLLDPPREDSKETIAKAGEYGIAVKMVTGDNVSIAREIAGQLGMGTDIAPAEKLGSPAEIEEADGYAQVFPEHKYQIVKALQERGHIVGMTGDGVNDAPALKQADSGVAVSGATDAARAAADLVLTAPGLSVIVRAVEEARRIFERMNSYAIYRITETIRIMFFVVLAMLTFNFYPITAVMIILLAFFNDLPIMTIAYDNTWLDPKPVRWNMRRVLTVSTVLGLVGVIETFGILLIGELWLKLDRAQVQTFIFLKLAIAGHLTLFVARTQRPFLTKPYPARSLLWSAIGTKLAVTLLCGFGLGLVAPLDWWVIGMVWGYCLIWVFIEDWAKLSVYRRHFLNKIPRHG